MRSEKWEVGSGKSFELIHLGGEKTVTGSCHLLRVNGVNILVDCGLAQGGERVAPMASWPVPPDKIDFLFLTHAHIDHIGRLPELISGGFRGEIITTEATAFLLAPLLEDALRLNCGLIGVMGLIGVRVKLFKKSLRLHEMLVNFLCWVE